MAKSYVLLRVTNDSDRSQQERTWATLITTDSVNDERQWFGNIIFSSSRNIQRSPLAIKRNSYITYTPGAYKLQSGDITKHQNVKNVVNWNATQTLCALLYCWMFDKFAARWQRRIQQRHMVQWLGAILRPQSRRNTSCPSQSQVIHFILSFISSLRCNLRPCIPAASQWHSWSM